MAHNLHISPRDLRYMTFGKVIEFNKLLKQVLKGKGNGNRG